MRFLTDVLKPLLSMEFGNPTPKSTTGRASRILAAQLKVQELWDWVARGVPLCWMSQASYSAIGDWNLCHRPARGPSRLPDVACWDERRPFPELALKAIVSIIRPSKTHFLLFFL
jgi:hypothetical protein